MTSKHRIPVKNQKMPPELRFNMFFSRGRPEDKKKVELPKTPVPVIVDLPVQKPKTSVKARKHNQLESLDANRRKSAPIRREPKNDTEFKVESALIELSELKTKVYMEKHSIEGKIRDLSTSPRGLRATFRPMTSFMPENREEQEVHHRLIVAENLMRQLYRRNKLLEETLSKPDRDRLDREAKLVEELQEKTQENARLQKQVLDLQKQSSCETSDSYIEFLETRVKETVEESKRHLQNYSQTKQLLMTNLKSSGSDDAVIKHLKQALTQEAANREKERAEYEAKLEKLRALASEHFVEKKQVLKQI